MKTVVVMETVNTDIGYNNSVELCKGEIPNTRAMHHVVTKGNELLLGKDLGYYHIIVLISGDVTFKTADKEYNYSERVTFVPSPKEDLTVVANTDVSFIEIQWDESPDDVNLLAEYKTVFPVVQTYRDSIQYTDPNKSEKTISRMMIPHRVIPRFAIGSVETYGVDLVKSHAHPMLDQFFFSFPENDMFVLINGEPIKMVGNQLMHIPLGADHGVDIPEGKHCHYMWIDFLPDNEKGLKRLDERHKVTGTMRSFDEENK